MTRTILVTIALLLASGTASALRVLELVERPVELSLSELTLPAAPGGTMTFKACASCVISTYRLTDDTVYRANGQTLPLAEFLHATEEIRAAPNGDKAFAAVFLDIATGRLTRIDVRG